MCENYCLFPYGWRSFFHILTNSTKLVIFIKHSIFEIYFPAPLPPDDYLSPPQSTTHQSRQGHPYPPPVSLTQDEELSHFGSIHTQKMPAPPAYPTKTYLPKLQEGDEFYLGSDEEDDWDDFEEVDNYQFFVWSALTY